MQSNTLKPKGIKFLARSYVASGLIILLINLILPIASIVPALDGLLSAIPGVNIVYEKALGMKYNTNEVGDNEDESTIWARFYVYTLLGIGFAYIVLGVALSRAKSWSIKLFSSMTIIFAVLAVFVGDLSLYVVDLGAEYMGVDRSSEELQNPILKIINKLIIVGAVIYPVIVDRYLHSSNVEAYFNSKTIAPTVDASYTHRSPF